MAALHHLDCPILEQRNGRIERQGNENPEVDINRYVTNKSFDSYLFQILENKQKAISQVMTSKTYLCQNASPICVMHFGIFNVLLQKNTGYDIIKKIQTFQGELNAINNSNM